MRVLAIDVGQRRVGLAISDPTRTLARPLSTVPVMPASAVEQVARAIAALAAEEDGVAHIVVGLPIRLNGERGSQTEYVTRFVDALRTKTAIPITLEDERLTSREAESRLALREKDWRKRKAK